MAIPAQLEDSTGPAGKWREPRKKLRLETQGALATGHATAVLVQNISATGLLLESDAALMIDEQIDIELPQMGTARAKVVWASGRLYGCQFKTPITGAALSAAQLRGSVEAEIDTAIAPPPFPDGSLGARLQRLRKERGLTQSDIAVQLGVSKPTVWAWEHGKARPVDSRMDALAEALGVPRAELMASPGLAAGSEVIARSRQEIAASFGADPEKVRIWIEL